MAKVKAKAGADQAGAIRKVSGKCYAGDQEGLREKH